MTLHFSEDELALRRDTVVRAIAAMGWDGLLMFRQESMYYLTGYDTFGYVFFNCLYLGVDGALTLVTRSADLRQARFTSMIDDIRIWVDRPDSDPARTDLLAVLEEHGCRGKTLGVEWNAYGLTAHEGHKLRAALDGLCTLADGSNLITRLRVIKSPAEIAYVRRAAELADDGLAEACRLAVPGAFEGDILAAVQGAVFRGGGDYPANEFVISSGPASLCVRYQADRRHLDDDDQLTIELAGVYRHYHAALFRTIKVGKANGQQKDMHRLCVDSLAAARAALVPGDPIGNVYAAYRRVVDAGGYGEGAHNACGYSLGATFAPNWMDWPMLYRDNAEIARPGMVFFLTPGVRDDADGLTAICGETVLVTETGSERLNKAPLEYVHNP